MPASIPATPEAAGGTHKTIQQVGGAVGTAIIGTTFFAIAQTGTSMLVAFAWAVGLVTAALLLTLLLAARLPKAIFARSADALKKKRL